MNNKFNLIIGKIEKDSIDDKVLTAIDKFSKQAITFFKSLFIKRQNCVLGQNETFISMSTRVQQNSSQQLRGITGIQGSTGLMGSTGYYNTFTGTMILTTTGTYGIQYRSAMVSVAPVRPAIVPADMLAIQREAFSNVSEKLQVEKVNVVQINKFQAMTD